MEQPDSQRAERDIFNIGEVHGDVVVQNQSMYVRDRNEKILLMAVKDEIESRLASSLHNAVFLTLGKDAQPEQVKRPWDREVKIGAKVATAIPDEMSIIQVFEAPEIRGKLLILGQPGAGKTTTLLDLAKALVEKAEASSSYPIPLLFNLSSWQDEKQSIRDWMLLEMRSKYGVSKKLGQQWVSDRVILPLLDGLDEVAPERQENCVKQINEFMNGESALLYIVICSRIAEYENYETSLTLGGAVYLRALSDGQIQEYLGKVGQQELWPFLSRNLELRDFVRAPLLLSMAVLTYAQNEINQWQQLDTASEQLRYLLDAYVEQMLNRLVKSHVYKKQKAPNAKQTRKWLGWLAKQMKQTSQTEFLIEEMQSQVLSIRQQQQYRLIIESCVFLIIGLSVGLSIGLIIELYYGLLIGLSAALTAQLIARLNIKMTQIKSLFYPSLNYSVKTIMNYGLSFGLISGFIGGLCHRLRFSLIYGLINGLIGGLTGGLVYALIIQQQPKITSIKVLKFSWPNFLRNGLISGLSFGMLSGLIIGLKYALNYGWNYGLFHGLNFGLNFGSSFGLISGLINGLSAKSLEINNFPNQGIKRSVKNFAVYGLSSGLIIWLSFEIIGWLGLVLLNWLYLNLIAPYNKLGIAVEGLTNYLTFGLLYGLLVGMIFGGFVCIQHGILRLLLYQSKLIPWNYARFLDYSTERLFLQRVGGRYRFVHRLLQDHFSQMSEEIEN
jgi:DNA polymerase III delta prime subunit